MYDDDEDDSRLACAFNPSIINRTCPSDCESAAVDSERDNDEVMVMLLLSLYVVVATAAAAAGGVAVEATASLVEGRDDSAAHAGFLGEDSVIMKETVADSIPWRSARRSAVVVVVVVVGAAIFIVDCLYDVPEIVVVEAIRLLELAAPPPATRNR